MNEPLTYSSNIQLEGLPALIAMLLMAAVFVVPAMKILQRIGIAPGWGLLAAVPFLNIIMLWVLAFMRWPGDDRI